MTPHHEAASLLAASVASALDQLSPRDQAAVVSGFYALAAPYLDAGAGGRCEIVENSEGEIGRGVSEGQGVSSSVAADPPRGAAMTVLQVLVKLSSGEKIAGDKLARKTGYSFDYIRAVCRPTCNLSKWWGVRNDKDARGYYLAPPFRSRAVAVVSHEENDTQLVRSCPGTDIRIATDEPQHSQADKWVVDPLTASIAATLAQLSPKDQAVVVSGLFALAAPYLSAGGPAETQVAGGDSPEQAPDTPDKKEPVALTEKHWRILRRLRRGPVGSEALADLVECSNDSIHRWCSPTKQGNVLHQVGVRCKGRMYHWLNPDLSICGAERVDFRDKTSRSQRGLQSNEPRGV